MKKLVGYDIDGVLMRMKPGEGAVIISGRTFDEYDDYAKRLASIFPVYIRGTGLYGDRKHAGEFKAKMIKILGVTDFYEDDDLQAEIIKKANPKCNIKLLK